MPDRPLFFSDLPLNSCIKNKKAKLHVYNIFRHEKMHEDLITPLHGAGDSGYWG